jgi:hypothetical protein
MFPQAGNAQFRRPILGGRSTHIARDVNAGPPLPGPGGGYCIRARRCTQCFIPDNLLPFFRQTMDRCKRSIDTSHSTSPIWQDLAHISPPLPAEEGLNCKRATWGSVLQRRVLMELEKKKIAPSPSQNPCDAPRNSVRQCTCVAWMLWRIIHLRPPSGLIGEWKLSKSNSRRGRGRSLDNSSAGVT